MVQALKIFNVYFSPTHYATPEGEIFRKKGSYRSTHFNKPVERSLKEKKLGGTKLSQKGYKRVRIQDYTYFVHSLVMYCYFGEHTSFEKQCNHINGNKTDNRVTNLEYCSLIENRRHAVKHGLHAIGESIGTSKLTDEQIKEIKELLEHDSQANIAKKYNVCQQNISAIARNITWKHII